MRGVFWMWVVLAPALMSGAPAQPAVTFYKHIAPMIYQNCSPCHRPGESAPFPLLSYDDVKKHSPQIATVTKSRFMPPWLPEAGHGDFAEERRLTDAQIQLIQDWVKAGSPAGPPVRGQAPPVYSSEWQGGTPDLVLRVSKPYQLAADGGEVFWNFIMPVPITTTRWVKAIEVRPGSARVFHHANVVLDRSGAARRQEATPGAGFEGMDLTIEEETFDPDGHFLSWKPGSKPVEAEEGMAWRADPGMNLVLNVHLRPSGKPEIINPEIALYFTDKPQSKFPMLVQLEHDGIIDIPPGEHDFLVTDEFRCTMDLNVLAVYPHAHYLGKLLEGYATLPDGTKKWLIRIPDWDLSWQGVYRLKSPLLLPAGTVVSMRYHYDNSADNGRNPNNPPKQVVGGNQAINEMGHLWLQVLPASGGDQRAKLQESLVRQRLEKYPDDFSANYTMGDLLLTQGDAAGAAVHFGKASAADPRSALAATEWGIALFTASRLPEAEVQFKRALNIDPNYTDARFDLASVEAAGAEWEAAAGDFRRAMLERPEDSRARQHLGEVLVLWADTLFKTGKHQDALVRYREALELRPGDAQLHGKTGVALAQLARLDEAQAEFETALRIDPKSEPAKQTLEVLKLMKSGPAVKAP